MDKHISAFLAIAKHDNVTVAAKEIGVTQPALTKRLNNLEKELNCRLFIRHKLGVTLTAAGRTFHKRAQRVEQEWLQANEELRCLENAGMDVLHIGAGPLFHQRYVAPVFSKLLLEFPALQLNLSVDTNEMTLPRLLRGEIDIVLGVIRPIGPDGAVVSIPMITLEHGVILPLSNQDTVNDKAILPQQMSNMRWVLYGADNSAEALLQHYFQTHGLGLPKISIRTASFATGLGLVKNSGFVMLAPTQLEPVIANTNLKIIKALPAISTLTSGAYVRPSSLGFPAVNRFLELLKEEINTPYTNTQAE